MTTITTESTAHPSFYQDVLMEKRGLWIKSNVCRGVGASLSSDVSRVAARCGLQREDWGGDGGCSQPKNTTKTLEEGVVFPSAGQTLRRFHKLLSECSTATTGL